VEAAFVDGVLSLSAYFLKIKNLLQLNDVFPGRKYLRGFGHFFGEYGGW
jgi:hypothetical protein